MVVAIAIAAVVLGTAAGGAALGASAQEDPGWVTNPANGHSYRLTAQLTWSDAEAEAVALGGHLATLNDAAEEAWVRETFGTLEHFWIGFNDIETEASWLWSSGEPVSYTNWCTGEPNDFNGEDAAIVNWGHAPETFGDCWNDLAVGGGHRGVVEITGDPPAPPPTAPEPDVLLGTDQNVPTCLNVYRANCGSLPGASVWWSAGAALAGAFRIAPDGSYEPELVDRVTVREPRGRAQPFALTYEIRDEATWSDGTPVSARDFVFTHAVLTDPANEVDPGARAAYSLIDSAVVVDAKTVRFEFVQPYAAWRDLFQWVLPAHVLEGYDFDTVWEDSIDDPATGEPVGSGPYLLTRFDGSTTFTFTRNAAWWSDPPALETVALRFFGAGGTQSLVEALEAGDLDAIYNAATFGTPDVLASLAGLRNDPALAIETNPGPGIEHLELNLAAGDMPLLADKWFRQAIASALDRNGLVTTLFGAVAPGSTAAHSLIYSPLQPEYEPHFAQYAYDPAKVAALMTDNGCTLGADSIWSCGGLRASVKLATTSGNALRARAQDELIANARAAGIELVADNSGANALFGTRLPSGAYQMSMFTWLGATGDPAGATSIYSCGGENNFTSYCSQSATKFLEGADAELDPARRAALVNRAESAIARDVPGIPLYRRPTFLAYRSAVVTGLRDNPVLVEGPLWNVEEWARP